MLEGYEATLSEKGSKNEKAMNIVCTLSFKKNVTYLV